MPSSSALLQADPSFRALAEHLPDIVYRYRVRPEGRVEYISGAVRHVLGYEPEAFYDDPTLMLRTVHPDDLSHVTAALGDENQWELPLVSRYLHRNGQTVWLESHQIRVNGDVVEGVARDVTALRQAQRERERMVAALEEAAEVVIITDAHGTIEYVNRGFERVTGWTREEAIGRNPRLLKSGQLPAEYYAAMWRRLTAGETVRHQLTNRCRDGSLYEADAVIAPVKDEQGRVTHFISLQRDVTNERRLDEQLRQAQKMEAVGQLTGGIAHDFNNLLTIVLGNAALIRERIPAGDADALAHLDDVERAVRAGASMIGKLLAFGRRERLTMTAVDVGPVIDDLVNRSLRRVLPAFIDVSVRCPGDLPPARCDRYALEQILVNLATNARDAMPGHGSLEIVVRVADLMAEDRGTVPVPHPGRYVCISVSDTGHGMDAATAARAFEPFYTTKPQGSGSGLGLSMVYGLMRQQGGAVHLYSEVAHGTTVRLYLPASTATAGTPAPSVPEDQAAPRGNGELVLLVEDEPALRVLASRILGRYGYRVLPAEDGVAALKLYEDSPEEPMLVLSDLVMPRMGGLELFQELQRRGSNARFLLATGYDHAQGRHLDSLTVVRKPWTVQHLLTEVRRVLSAAPG
jgi:two-component system, cell cycle sensor histidine kinase and response regulator CckA